MNGESLASPLDECYRCGYDLRGISDEQACPECGLLARRSRRESDELHNTRPRWLWSISWGVKLILLSLLFAVGWGIVAPQVFGFLTNWDYQVFLAGFGASAILFEYGIFLLTRREGYPPADAEDRRLRIWLRVSGAAPALAIALLAIFVELFWIYFSIFAPTPNWPNLFLWAAVFVGTLGDVPVPFLLFRVLRSLARRARSAHLAEHCTIVGIGMSAALVYAIGVILLGAHPEWCGLGPEWLERSESWLVLIAIAGVAAVLFPLWSAYLLIRFAIAFHIAARKLRGQWSRDDRSAGETAEKT